MNLYQTAVWNELKNTTEEYTRLIELSQNYETAHLVTREKLDTIRLKMNGLMSQLDDATKEVA